MLFALLSLIADAGNGGGGAGGGGGGLGGMLPFIIVMAAAMYFLFYLPSKRERNAPGEPVGGNKEK